MSFLSSIVTSLTKPDSKSSKLAEATDWCQLRAERLAERIREGAREQYEFPRRDHYRRIRESSLEDRVITGLRSLSIDGDNGLSKLQEQPNHEESETEPIMNHDPTATQDSAATQEPTANQ